MDAQIERLVKSCAVCQESRPSPAPAPLHPWEWPSEPWSRLHIDFAGPFLNHMFMIVVDAHSKWIEASIMSTITATKTIEQLRIIFAMHGLPRKVVTDNGPTFTSEQFRNFMSLNGIAHMTTAPYHPSSNGLAERAVQTVKQGLKRTAGPSLQVSVHIQNHPALNYWCFTIGITNGTSSQVPPGQTFSRRIGKSPNEANQTS